MPISRVALLACCLALATGIPAWARTADACQKGLPQGWGVIDEASSASSGFALCNYRVNRTVDGKQHISGTAITIETYCSPAEGKEAFDGKTGDRELTETKRVDGERLIIEEGEFARTASGQPNPDNPHRDGVFSQYFPDTNFRLFEKEWLALNPQIVATIVVLTSERGAVEEDKRYGVDDAEPVAATLAKEAASSRSDCKVPTTIAVPVGASSPQAGGGGGGGGGTGALVPVLIAAGTGGAVVEVARRRRKRKYTPPRTYGGRGNPWEPDLETQKRKWDKDKLVWDPDTLTWREPKDSDFVDVPEVPTPIERQIPENEVPPECQDAYTRYINEQGDARTLKRTIYEAQERLSRSRARLRTNSIRAKAQLGADIVGAIGAMSGAALAAAKSAMTSATTAGARGGVNVASLAQEARARAAQRAADLDGEMRAARSKLAASQLEMDSSGLSPSRIASTFDEATEEVTRIRKSLAEVDGPAELAAKRAALVDEQAKIKAQIQALESEKEILSEFINFRWKFEDAWKQKGFKAYFDQRQQAIDAELETFSKAQPHDYANLSPEAKSRFDALLKAKAKLTAEHDEAFELFVRGEKGYEHIWPTSGQDAANRKAEIANLLKDLTERSERLEFRLGHLDQDIKDLANASPARRSEMDADRARLSGELAEAEGRRTAALQSRQRLDALNQAVQNDQAAVDALQGRILSHKDKIAELERTIEGISSAKSPGAIPAVMLGGMLAWLAPAAAAALLVGLAAAKTAQAAGIGMQSPDEILGILLDNKLEILTLEDELHTAVPKFEEVLTKMAATSKELTECIARNRTTAPWRPSSGGEAR